MSLAELEAEGILEPLAATQAEIHNLMKAAQRWLEDADVEQVSDTGRFDSAYNAVLGCAIAALRANGYRVAGSAGKHYVALNSLRDTIGIDLELIHRLQKMRQRRNLDLYSGGRPTSAIEREWAVRTARELVSRTASYLSQLRLPL